MPVVELLSPGASPGPGFLRDLSRTVTSALGIGEGHCWVRWTRVDRADAYRPEWEREGTPAPVVLITAKESYDQSTIGRMLQRLVALTAERVGCAEGEVYVAVDRVRAGDLHVRGRIWTGDDMANGEDDGGTVRLRPIGTVRGGRSEPTDDFWGGERARIELDPALIPEEALAELDSFSHLEVVFLFHKVVEGTEETGARRPRNNPDWPEVGILAQRAKRRPNRLGVSRCRLLGVDGLTLSVEGLDAIDGSPVLDVKPYMREFGPIGEVRQPEWATVVMEQYYAEGVR